MNKNTKLLLLAVAAYFLWKKAQPDMKGGI